MQLQHGTNWNLFSSHSLQIKILCLWLPVNSSPNCNQPQTIWIQSPEMSRGQRIAIKWYWLWGNISAETTDTAAYVIVVEPTLILNHLLVWKIVEHKLKFIPSQNLDDKLIIFNFVWLRVQVGCLCYSHGAAWLVLEPTRPDHPELLHVLAWKRCWIPFGHKI